MKKIRNYLVSLVCKRKKKPIETYSIQTSPQILEGIYCLYKYIDEKGNIFTCTGKNLAECRKRRNEWMKTLNHES